MQNNNHNKNIKIVLIIWVGISLFMSTISPIINGMAGFMMAGKFIESVIEYFTGNGEDESAVRAGLNEDKLLDAMKNGCSLSSEQEKSMRISSKDFEYLLTRISQYNHAGEVTRTITIHGLREYTETIHHPDSTDPDTGETISGGTETVERTEDVTKQIEVSNRMYEGLIKYDYRLFYYYCLMAACDRKTSDTALSGVTPRDKDLKPITGAYENEYPKDNTRYYITREDIDKVFTYTSVGYEYSFDVLRDTKTEYTMDECKALPHEENIYGDKSTASGRYTFYWPRSLLNSGHGGYSELVNVTSTGKGIVNGARETFSYDTMLKTAKSLRKSVTEQEIEQTFSFITGGEVLLSKLKSWGIAGYAVESGKVNIIVPSASGSTASGSGSTASGGSGTAALGLSADRAANLDEVWKYLKDTMGFSNAAAAGVCGNAMQESAFNPEAGKNSGPAGIFQWAGERRNGLLKKDSPWTVATQLEYFRTEWNASYQSSCNSYSRKYFGCTFKDLTDAADACEVFCVCFEGCVYDPSKGYGKGSSPSKSTMASNGKRYQDLETRQSYATSIFLTKAGYSGGEPYTGTDLPYYHQFSSEWGNIELGIGKISSRGCSLCSAAMAASYCLGVTVTPQTIVDIPEVYQWTSTHDTMSQECYQLALRKLGVKYNILDRSANTATMKAQIISALTKHHPVILSVKKGSYGFTKQTHYIVLRYIDSSGGIHLHDPSHPENSSKTFDLSEILTQLNNRYGCAEIYCD